MLNFIVRFQVVIDWEVLRNNGLLLALDSTAWMGEVVQSPHSFYPWFCQPERID